MKLYVFLLQAQQGVPLNYYFYFFELIKRSRLYEGGLPNM